MLHRILWDYLDARRSCRMTWAELRELQDKRLRTLLHHAYRNVPYYHDAFAERNLTPDQIRGAEELRLLPLLTRKVAQDNYPDRILDSGGSARESIIRRTSGTTGRPLEVVWDNEYCDMVVAMRLVAMKILGLSVFDRAVDIQYWGPEKTGTSPRLATSRLRKVFAGPVTTPYMFTLRSRMTGFRREVWEVEAELLKLRPAGINSRPSYLRRLGQHLAREGEKLQVRKIQAGGEYLSVSVREELEDLFDAEVFNTFGCQELGLLGLECREHSGIHLFSDHFVFEFLRDGESAAAGEEAELVVTPLHNKTMPLIRYQLGDVVVPHPDTKCACGLSLPKIREVMGRPDDGLLLPGGSRLPIGPVADHIETLGFRDYQLAQTGMKSISVKLVQNQSTGEPVHELVTYIRSMLGDDVEIKLQVWNECDIPPKYRPVLRQF